MSRGKGRDIKKYAQYMRDQVTCELLTNYGKIDILWFDFSYSQNNPKLAIKHGRKAKVRTTGRQKN